MQKEWTVLLHGIRATNCITVTQEMCTVKACDPYKEAVAGSSPGLLTFATCVMTDSTQNLKLKLP